MHPTVHSAGLASVAASYPKTSDMYCGGATETYASLSSAESACATSSSCTAVFHPGCNSLAWKLCTTTTFYSSSVGSCVYKKPLGEIDGGTCTGGSQCSSGVCRGGNCCGPSGRTGGCTDCNGAATGGDCSPCSSGYTKKRSGSVCVSTYSCVVRAQTCTEGRDAGMACTSPAILDASLSCASNVCHASEFGGKDSRCCKLDSSVPCAGKNAPSMVATSIPKTQCGAIQSEWETAWSTKTIKTLEQCRAQCLADASCTGIVTGTFLYKANQCAMCTSRSTASTNFYSAWATYQAKKEDTGKACDASTIVSPTKECVVAVCTSASSGSATKRCAAYECDAGEYGHSGRNCCDAKPRQKCNAAGLTCADSSTIVSSSARSVMRGREPTRKPCSTGTWAPTTARGKGP